ncbi:nucleoside phosphorylase [bacterium]|nr:nucleoside phosphorylase [bacterium]
MISNTPIITASKLLDLQPQSNNSTPFPHCAVMFFFPNVEQFINKKSIKTRITPFSSKFPFLNIDNKFTVVYPGMGAPMATSCLEILCALGITHVIFIGLCGSIDPSLCRGDFIIIKDAFIDEGTSLHYEKDTGNRVTASNEIRNSIEHTISSLSLPYHKGSIWTTDGLFRETPQKVAHFQSKGCLAVDMEASALISAAQFNGLKIGGLLMVSDSLQDSQWIPKGKKIGHSYKKPKALLQLAVDILTPFN